MFNWGKCLMSKGLKAGRFSCFAITCLCESLWAVFCWFGRMCWKAVWQIGPFGSCASYFALGHSKIMDILFVTFCFAFQIHADEPRTLSGFASPSADLPLPKSPYSSNGNTKKSSGAQKYVCLFFGRSFISHTCLMSFWFGCWHLLAFFGPGEENNKIR